MAINFNRLRFAVGNSDDQIISSWWFVSAKRSDVYLGVGALGGWMKTTFHQSGECHVRRSSNPAWGELANGRIVAWKRRETPEVGTFHAATIVFPTDFLRGVLPKAVPGRLNLLFPPAPRGSAVEVGLFYSKGRPSPSLEQGLLKVGMPLVYWPLENGEAVSLVARIAPFDASFLGPLAALAVPGESVKMPPAEWTNRSVPLKSPELNQTLTAINEPDKTGHLVIVQVSGLRIVLAQ